MGNVGSAHFDALEAAETTCKVLGASFISPLRGAVFRKENLFLLLRDDRR